MHFFDSLFLLRVCPDGAGRVAAGLRALGLIVGTGASAFAQGTTALVGYDTPRLAPLSYRHTQPLENHLTRPGLIQADAEAATGWMRARAEAPSVPGNDFPGYVFALAELRVPAGGLTLTGPAGGGLVPVSVQLHVAATAAYFPGGGSGLVTNRASAYLEVGGDGIYGTATVRYQHSAYVPAGGGALTESVFATPLPGGSYADVVVTQLTNTDFGASLTLHFLAEAGTSFSYRANVQAQTDNSGSWSGVTETTASFVTVHVPAGFGLTLAPGVFLAPAIPEPATTALLAGLGALAAVVGWRRRSFNHGLHG